jgi:magnesium-transporting ATPase (P-type)
MTNTEQSQSIQAGQWYARDIDDIFTEFQTDVKGLSDEEVRTRLEKYGPNSLPPPPRRPAWYRFLLQFHNVLIYVLLAAAVVTALLADWVDSGVILGVVVINAIIGFLQEGKAEKAVDAIRQILSHEAVVMRDGHRHTVTVEGLVPGDIVLLQAGDKVPADLRLFEVKDLRIEEAALTGESVPVDKDSAPTAPGSPLGDRTGMAFSSTLVSYGMGRGVVVATGAETEIGKVSALLARVQSLATRLTQHIDEFSKWLTGAILILAAGTLFFGLLVRDYTFTELFFASVALAVAAIPEGLPAIITITLALGVQRMARRNAIIRRLPAVETLGSVTTICSDKTGTLTKNEMTATTIVTADGEYDIDGAGYEPVGSFRKDGAAISASDDPDLMELLRAGMLCNEGELYQEDGKWQVQGDPTDGAILTVAAKAGLSQETCLNEQPRLDIIPFASEHKFMASLHSSGDDGAVLFVKGAPERVAARCSRQRSGGGEVALQQEFWTEVIENIARSGRRTLAVAVHRGYTNTSVDIDDIGEDLVLLGIYGLIDPPREEAITAVRSCQDAGIQVKMITGDHVLTASAIGAQIGLAAAEKAVTGEMIEQMDDDQLLIAARRTSIFARVSPEHKLRLVSALQADGQVVAMTGDGINDAPALKRADVGVAMGKKGTEAAKEAAEVVLADDNFASIASAVRQGRTVYDNIRKTLAFVLPTNGAQAGIIIASVMIGISLPITPLQILWVNMVTAVTLGLALAFEPPEGDVMRRSPRPPDEPLLTQFLSWRIVFISAIMVMGTLGLFLWDLAHDETLQMARTTAVNTLIFFQIFYLFNARYLKASAFSREALLGNRAVLFAVAGIASLQMLFTYLPLFQQVFGTAAIPLGDWFRLLCFTVSVFFLVEIEKAIMRWLDRRKAQSAGLKRAAG